MLRTNRIGEIHRGLTILSRDSGIIRAIAHGAESPRGKLRGRAVVFASGRIFLYTNPRTQSTKITDMDPSDYFSGIRSDLHRFYTASLWAEIVLSSFASGGHADRVYDLLVDCLSYLNAASSDGADRVSVQFLWRFLDLSGSQPSLTLCACCGEAVSDRDSVVYVAGEGFCAGSHGCTDVAGHTAWSSGARMYLRHTSALTVAEAMRVSPPPGATVTLKRVLYQMIQEHVESPLKTLQSGAGII